MVIESYGVVLWAVPRFRRASSYPTTLARPVAVVDVLRDKPPASILAVEPDVTEGAACLSAAH